jgi:hypothetical protein
METATAKLLFSKIMYVIWNFALYAFPRLHLLTPRMKNGISLTRSSQIGRKKEETIVSVLAFDLRRLGRSRGRTQHLYLFFNVYISLHLLIMTSVSLLISKILYQAIE